MGQRLTYVYCLVEGRRPPSLKGVPAGLPGASKPRLLEVDDDLRLVVADVPAERYGEDALEQGLRDLDWVSRCAVGHERVVEAFLESPAVLPMKLYTLFLDDERAIAHVRGKRRRLGRVLERVAGCAEWGLRVTLDERKAAPARAAATSGTAFLQAKKASRDAIVELAARTRRDAEAVHRALSGRAAAAHRTRPGAAEGAVGARLLLDAAYLVPARQGARFRAAATRAAKDLTARGCTVSLSGPWPPYHFVGEA